MCKNVNVLTTIGAGSDLWFPRRTANSDVSQNPTISPRLPSQLQKCIALGRYKPTDWMQVHHDVDDRVTAGIESALEFFLFDFKSCFNNYGKSV